MFHVTLPADFLPLITTLTTFSRAPRHPTHRTRLPLRDNAEAHPRLFLHLLTKSERHFWVVVYAA